MTALHGETALVTGSARGIGRAIAVRYGALGARVVVNYANSAEAADKTVAEIRALDPEAVAIQADVADLAALEDLFQQSADAFGQLDIVVANAGVELVDQPIDEVTEEHLAGPLARWVSGQHLLISGGAPAQRDPAPPGPRTTVLKGTHVTPKLRHHDS